MVGSGVFPGFSQVADEFAGVGVGEAQQLRLHTGQHLEHRRRDRALGVVGLVHVGRLLDQVAAVLLVGDHGLLLRGLLLSLLFGGLLLRLLLGGLLVGLLLRLLLGLRLSLLLLLSLLLRGLLLRLLLLLNLGRRLLTVVVIVAAADQRQPGRAHAGASRSA